MIAPLAKFVDWSALQVTSRRRPLVNGGNSRLDEAIQFLAGPNFIPPDSEPAQVEFNPDPATPVNFHFPTPRPSQFAENNIVSGWLYRSTARWQERPVIILLEGAKSAAIARRCNRAGYNAMTLVLPYRLQRRPRQPGTLSEPDYLRDAEAAAQAVAEIRALTGWLRREGCPAVALWGGSYGGWLAGLMICRDARVTAAVLTVPRVRSNCSMAELVIWRRAREALREQRVARERLNQSPWNLTLAQPVIPRENVLLVEATHDLLVPKNSVGELWQAWGRPAIWRVPHGHYSFSLIATPCYMANRILDWLKPRLAAPVGQKTA